MGDEEALDGRALHADFVDSLGIESLFTRVYTGREKDLLMEPTDAQSKLVAKLAKSLIPGNSSVSFDILDAPRIIVHQGKIQRKSMYLDYCYCLSTDVDDVVMLHV